MIMGQGKTWESAVPPSAEELLDHGDGHLSTLRLIPWLLSPLVVITAVLCFREPNNPVSALSLLTAIALLGYAVLAMGLVRRAGRAQPIYLLNAIVFGLVITLLLFASSVLSPRATSHNVMYALYLLFIGASALSSEPRVTLAASLLSLGGFITWVACLEGGLLSGGQATRIALEQDLPVHASKACVIGAMSVTSMIAAARGKALRRVSLQDGLTGLLNRHAFDRCLQAQAVRAALLDRPLSVAMIDVDHFKGLNDAHGHAVGDSVLRAIASLIRESVRSTDLVTRYGGDEFVVAFLDTDHLRLDERLEELRLRVREIGFETRDGSRTSVTLSIGVARVPAEVEGVERAVAEADRRLYEAKRQGRDRIVTQGSPGAET